MNENERSVLVEEKIVEMSNDAKELHKLIKYRDDLIYENEMKLKNEKRQHQSTLEKIRDDQSNMRCAKNDCKEQERQKVSRTVMANLVTAADYPGCPSYVHHIINVLKNILGIQKFFYFYFLLFLLLFFFPLRRNDFNSRDM